MNSNNLQNKAEESEILTADEKKISEFVAALERVSAPNDFEFRLKARIANGEKESYQAGYWQWLRYLLPIGASAFVLAFVLYGTNFFAPSTPTEQAVDVEPNKSAEVVTKPIETPSNTIVAATNSNENEDFSANSAGRKNLPPKNAENKAIFISDRTNLKKKELPKKSIEENGGGSRDSAVTTPSVKLPEGLNPDKELKNPQDAVNSQAFTAKEILKDIGLETASENNKLKVKSIIQNSPAGLSGVEVGDIIEAIDEQKINGNSNLRNFSGVKKLTVSRDGKTTIIDLKSN